MPLTMAYSSATINVQLGIFISHTIKYPRQAGTNACMCYFREIEDKAQ